MGGLGNQMFQYACARALSLRLDTDLVLDTSYFADHPTYKFDYSLEVFQIHVIHPTKIPDFALVVESYINDRRMKFDREILTLPDNVFLYGYWQFEGYFSDFEREIRRDFTLKNPISDLSRAWANRIQNDPMSVSLHIRRTDYINKTNQNIFHQLPIQYYERCIGFLRENFPEISLYIFSDDLNWCRQHFNFGVPTYFVDGNDDSRSHEDMFLMSLCRHHVIANSSFSFWGAWLDNRVGSLIFAPRKTFKTYDPINESSRLPAQWIIFDD